MDKDQNMVLLDDAPIVIKLEGSSSTGEINVDVWNDFINALSLAEDAIRNEINRQEAKLDTDDCGGCKKD